ncbi:hypothetical protein PTT_07256 [Pyrenophora teres f. teres 0-1]|uniref:Uncharacterized protein n=1 Tax=Pyrenophora teres f. teres (strain 0-1) TaxID=861557 RepID=E3RH84_PYRTT|nr:hypothetical protein PTT_07256 [Pyrenophora teres f. teres 0-1]
MAKQWKTQNHMCTSQTKRRIVDTPPTDPSLAPAQPSLTPQQANNTSFHSLSISISIPAPTETEIDIHRYRYCESAHLIRRSGMQTGHALHISLHLPRRS